MHPKFWEESFKFRPAEILNPAVEILDSQTYCNRTNQEKTDNIDIFAKTPQESTPITAPKSRIYTWSTESQLPNINEVRKREA